MLGLFLFCYSAILSFFLFKLEDNWIVIGVPFPRVSCKRNQNLPNLDKIFPFFLIF